MADFFSSNDIQEYSVSEISNAIKQLVEGEFSYVKIRGEISGFKLAPSGHAYMSLKDEQSLLSAVCWRGTISKIKMQIEDGLEVIAVGRITTYGARSNYQLVIEYMEPAGMGALMALLEKRKQQLAKEGLFDQKRKKAIPFFPKKIGVITSPTGAVIRDILHRIEDRFPTNLLLWPVNVQGDEAASQITEAISGFNLLEDNISKPDVLIVARGGGSIEDLWPFNEEMVVRAVAASSIPIISAVGHETDTTLIDYAADLRAPTPTAAAEFATPVKSELIFTINNNFLRLNKLINSNISNLQQNLTNMVRSLQTPKNYILHQEQRLDDIFLRLSGNIKYSISANASKLENLTAKIKRPDQAIEIAKIKIDNLSDKITRLWKSKEEEESKKLDFLTKLLDSYHYKKILKRGFSIVRDKDNKIIDSAKKVKHGALLTIEFSDGKEQAFADKKEKQESLF